MHSYLRALSYYRRDLAKIFLLLGLITAATLLGLLQAWPIAILMDSVLMPAPRHDWIHRLMMAPLPNSRIGQILGLAMMTFAFRLGQEGLNMARTLVGHHINYNGLLRIRRDLYRKVQSLTMAYHGNRPQGDTIYRLSYDTYGCLIILNTFIIIAVAVLTLVSMAALMLSRNWQLTLMALGVAPPLLFTNIWFGRKLKKRTDEGRIKDSEFLTTVQRSVGLISLVQAFGREAHEFKRFEEAAIANIRAWIRMHWHEVVYGLAVGVIFGLGGTLIFGYGGYLVYRDQFVLHTPGGMTIGDLMIVLTYLTQLYDPLNKLSGAGATMMGGVAAAERVFEVLDEEPMVQEAPHAISLPRQPRTVRLENVSFSYHCDRMVIRNVDVTIRPGEMVAFVGPSGAGKSTLLNLLPRFFDPIEGALRLDEYDFRDIRLKDLRKHIALVLQESILLPTTIAENIAYGRVDASEAEIREAAELCGAADFIEALPGKYRAAIAEGRKCFPGDNASACPLHVR